MIHLRTFASSTARLCGALFALGAVASAQTVHHVFVHAPSAFGTSPVSAGVGDIDGDGFDDVALCNRLIAAGRGRITVLSGRDGTVLGTRTGGSSHDNLGQSVVPVGDVDGDGFDDLAVSAPSDDDGGANSGRVTILHGPALTPGVTIDGAAGERLGARLRTAGDVDGDGIEDLAASVSLNSAPVRLYSGASGALLRQIPNTPFEWSFGADFAGVGDLDGDGVPELAVGVPGAHPTGVAPNTSFGGVRVFSGSDGSQLFDLVRPAGESDFGERVTAAGDVDGDGVPDILVGSPGRTQPPATYTRGKAFVYSGSDGTLLREYRNADSLTLFGVLVLGVGDLDADGHDDVAVGSQFEHNSGLPVGAPRGGVQVFSGATGEVLLDVRSHPSAPIVGTSLTFAGDVNADGYADLCIGALDGTEWPVLVVGRDDLRGTPYCLGRPHSTGDRARLTAMSPSGFLLAANDVTLQATTLPPNVLGYFLVGVQRGIVPAAGDGDGTLCIAGPDFGRYADQVLSSGALGQAELTVDAGAIPMVSAGGSVAAAPGDTFGFQFWFRDSSASGAAGSNLSDAYAVTYR